MDVGRAPGGRGALKNAALFGPGPRNRRPLSGAIHSIGCSPACGLMSLTGMTVRLAKDEEAAADMEERFALHISIVAKDI